MSIESIHTPLYTPHIWQTAVLLLTPMQLIILLLETKRLETPNRHRCSWDFFFLYSAIQEKENVASIMIPFLEPEKYRFSPGKCSSL